MSDLLSEVRALLAAAESSVSGEDRALVSAARRRIDEPLRVAFAGRIKAGKSTLLNAIIGAEIAASDAAECTRYVTWYRHGEALRAFGVDPDGNRYPLTFLEHHAIDVSPMRAIERLEVEYPSPILTSTTLIDTPGIASISEHVSQRSEEFLAPSGDQGADVLIYLLRFLHERDANFLEAFTDPSAIRADPLRSLAVLSRADEIGVGRGDGFAIARHVARRYAESSVLRGVVSDVLPVSGLLGLHAAALDDTDLEALRVIARLPLRGQERVLLSADRVVGQVVPGVASQVRASLVHRLGFHGFRTAVAMLRREPDADLDRLRASLTFVSGVVPLRRTITDRYAGRADILKASRALDVVGSIVQRGSGGRDLAREHDRIDANAQEIVELRTLRDIADAHAANRLPALSPRVLRAVEAALGADGVGLHHRLQLTSSSGDLHRRALARIDELRTEMSSPVLPRAWQDVIRVAVRSIEAALHRSGQSA